MRSLVTGAAGFVGQHLISHLRECGDEVLATDLLMPRSNLGCSAQMLDICDPDACAKVLNSFKPEVIYHLAGMAFVPDAEANFEKALRANVLGTSIIYRMCHLLELRCKIVLISSAEVYGVIQAQDLPITELTPLRPMNNYSLSKAMGELVAARYERTGCPRSVIIRPFNHIGPGQNIKFVSSAFAAQLARIAKGKSSNVVEVGNLEAKRDFCDVRDIVRAYRLAAENGEGVYNLCSGQAVAIQSLLDQLIEISKTKVKIVQNPDRMRGPEIPVLYGSYEKAQRELGWTPRYSLAESLSDIFNYWMEQ
ncbi:MAG: NAD-dependent epimerase/dehydratase family protein [SAR324 cluster bacterium]|uniref:NAD-dependent epimerase/dehydratase family protein n=1 Tax=SAR324 cluster bacterium TaxID=2024889 RepID=A0A7X9FRM2_9DELT|nr:NAD-dependent epimerase/dehydratase family protein [SAR324 cluster bacterium]